MIAKAEVLQKLKKMGMIVADDASVVTVLLPKDISFETGLKDVRKKLEEIGYEASFCVKQSKDAVTRDDVAIHEEAADEEEQLTEEEIKNKFGFFVEALKYGKVSLNHFIINLNDIKLKYKNSDCTLSIFLVSMLAYSLYETNYKNNKGKKPINVCVPINLKKYFKSNTITNFVSHAMLSIKPTNITSLGFLLIFWF